MKVFSVLICFGLLAVASNSVIGQSAVPRPHHASSTSLSMCAHIAAVGELRQVDNSAPHPVFSNNQIEVAAPTIPPLAYKIYDQLGMTVLEGFIDEANTTISITSLVPDKYYLQLLGESVRTHVFVKEDF